MCRYGQGGTEPTLDEVIHEPVIRLMMERDTIQTGAHPSLFPTPMRVVHPLSP